jgi:hypothetical protein
MTDTALPDSYIETDTELETLIGSDPRASAVALKALAAASQAWYCQEATRHIDALPLRGQKYDLAYTGSVANQPLEFPRVIDGETVGNGGEYLTTAVVPDIVKRACLEEAIAIYQAGSSGGLKDLQEQGVQAMSIGGKLSYTFVSGGASSPLLSAAAKRIMRRYVGAVVR